MKNNLLPLLVITTFLHGIANGGNSTALMCVPPEACVPPTAIVGEVANCVSVQYAKNAAANLLSYSRELNFEFSPLEVPQNRSMAFMWFNDFNEASGGTCKNLTAESPSNEIDKTLKCLEHRAKELTVRAAEWCDTVKEMLRGVSNSNSAELPEKITKVKAEALNMEISAGKHYETFCKHPSALNMYLCSMLNRTHIFAKKIGDVLGVGSVCPEKPRTLLQRIFRL
ncbi:MAG: hypothetical protein LBF72_00500 [Holosporales bacterium]|jgi:hypothetical protein|nr:hypothetical protein [Holosporales bacterium]